jgi:hypothetical protein
MTERAGEVSKAGKAGDTDTVRDLTNDELNSVSGGCPCTNNPYKCGCDKPSPGHP